MQAQKVLHLLARHWQTMLFEVTRWAPEEACGLLAGRGEEALAVYPVVNSLHRPDRYEMDPAGQVRAFSDMEAQGMELIGIYHSHPGGPAIPSPTDLQEAYYPEAVYVIWSPAQRPKEGWQACGFLLNGNHFDKVELVVTEEM